MSVVAFIQCVGTLPVLHIFEHQPVRILFGVRLCVTRAHTLASEEIFTVVGQLVKFVIGIAWLGRIFHDWSSAVRKSSSIWVFCKCFILSFDLNACFCIFNLFTRGYDILFRLLIQNANSSKFKGWIFRFYILSVFRFLWHLKLKWIIMKIKILDYFLKLFDFFRLFSSTFIIVFLQQLEIHRLIFHDKD